MELIHVISLELAEKLKELGVDTLSVFRWYFNRKDDSWLIGSDGGPGYNISAFTASELMEILPHEIPAEGEGFPPNLGIVKNDDSYTAGYTSDDGDSEYFDRTAKSLPDALALLLIHLIEQGYYEPTGTRVL